MGGKENHVARCRHKSDAQEDAPAKGNERLKEEIAALIAYVNVCTETDNQWFHLEPSEDGLRWWDKVWIYHNMLKYEFDIEFDVRASDVPLTDPRLFRFPSPTQQHLQNLPCLSWTAQPQRC